MVLLYLGRAGGKSPMLGLNPLQIRIILVLGNREPVSSGGAGMCANTHGWVSEYTQVTKVV